MLLLFGFAKAQSKANCIYKPVGSNNLYKGVVYFDVDKSGDPYLIGYNIFGIENGQGEFYQGKEYPTSADEKIKDVTYRYSTVINGAGIAYFNLECKKCR